MDTITIDTDTDVEPYNDGRIEDNENFIMIFEDTYSDVDKNLSKDRDVEASSPSSSNRSRSRENNQFPFELVEKEFTTTYVYKLPGNRCYRFIAYDKTFPMHTGELKKDHLVCRSCCQAYEELQDMDMLNERLMERILERKTDYYSMETDPTMDHFYGCKPEFFLDVVDQLKEMPLDPEEDEAEYDFPLMRLNEKDTYSVIHRINVEEDDDPRCYRFVFTGSVRSGHSLHCLTCKDGKFNSKAYKCTSAGFTFDPTTHHNKGCRPMRYYNVMRSHRICDEETVYKMIPQHGKRGRPKARKSKNKKSGGVLNGLKRRRTISESEETISDKITPPKIASVPIEPLDNADPIYLGTTKDVITVVEEPCDHGNGTILRFTTTTHEVVWPEPQHREPETTEPSWPPRVQITGFPEEIVQDAKDMHNEQIQIAQTENFKITLDVPIFNCYTDDVSAELFDKLMTITFERKSRLVDGVHIKLEYSFLLPESVNLSSIKTDWTTRGMHITANIIL